MRQGRKQGISYIVAEISLVCCSGVYANKKIIILAIVPIIPVLAFTTSIRQYTNSERQDKKAVHRRDRFDRMIEPTPKPPRKFF